MTKYYVFRIKVLVGCWADSIEEAKDFIDSGGFDALEHDTHSAKYRGAYDSEPDGSRPFTQD